MSGSTTRRRYVSRRQAECTIRLTAPGLYPVIDSHDTARSNACLKPAGNKIWRSVGLAVGKDLVPNEMLFDESSVFAQGGHLPAKTTYVPAMRSIFQMKASKQPLPETVHQNLVKAQPPLLNKRREGSDQSRNVSRNNAYKTRYRAVPVDMSDDPVIAHAPVHHNKMIEFSAELCKSGMH